MDRSDFIDPLLHIKQRIFMELQTVSGSARKDFSSLTMIADVLCESY